MNIVKAYVGFYDELLGQVVELDGECLYWGPLVGIVTSVEKDGSEIKIAYWNRITCLLCEISICYSEIEVGSYEINIIK